MSLDKLITSNMFVKTNQFKIITEVHSFNFKVKFKFLSVTETVSEK